MKPRVSVVIPAFNRGRTLGRAIHSALEQGMRDIEVIVADDGSTDDTPDVVGRFGDPRLVYLRRPVRGGAGAARNSGVAAARAPLIAFLDSDDEWLSGRLASSVAALEGAGEQVELCLCALLRWNGRNVVYSPARERRATREGRFREDILFHNYALTSGWLVRSSAFARHGGFDEALRSLVDWEWLVRFSRDGRVVLVDEPLVMVYQSPDSISSHGRNYIASMQRMIGLHGAEVTRAQLANWYYVQGRMQALHGDPGAARRTLWQAWRMHPRDRRALAGWLLACGGSGMFRTAWRAVRRYKGFDEQTA